MRSPEPEGALVLCRLRLDIDDLRFENDRLKASVAEKQQEIVVLSERLGLLQARLDRLHRLTAWSVHLRRFGPLRLLLRRRA